jgi:uncharacterized membrane protein YfcA
MARPNLSYLRNLALALAGLPCGLVTGLTGISNTYLSASLLHWLTGIKERKLNGTVLVIAGFSAFTGILAYSQRHLVLILLAVVCGAGFLAGAALGARVQLQMGRRSAIGGVIGAVLLLGAGVLMVATGLHLIDAGNGLISPAFKGYSGIVGYGVLGALVGYLGRITEVWGLLIVPSLVYFAGLSIGYAQGAALLILLASTIPLGLVFARAGETEPRASIWTSFGSLFGALIGSQVATGHVLRPSTLIFIHGLALLILGMARLTQRPEPQTSSAV